MRVNFNRVLLSIYYIESLTGVNKDEYVEMLRQVADAKGPWHAVAKQ